MIEADSRIRAAIRRAEDYFDRVAVSPPATDSALARFSERFPDHSDQLDTFYAVANGVRVGLRDYDVGHIYSIEESLESHAVAFAHDPSRAMLLPVRGDGCGNADCVVLGVGVAKGSVVFWDHEIDERPAYLLGSSLASYLDMWSDHLVHQYLPQGEIHPRADSPEIGRWPWLGAPELQHPWPFDTVWMVRRDPGLADLLKSPSVTRWLAQQE
jgi:hypothetical protein